MFNVYAYLNTLLVSSLSKQYLNQVLRLMLTVAFCSIAVLGVHAIAFLPCPDPWP